MPLPVLLLDVMSTLVRDPFYEDVPAFFNTTLDEIYTGTRQGSWTAFERGELDQPTFLRQYFSDGRTFDHAAFIAELIAGYRWLDGIEVLLGQLQAAGHPMHAFSNYPIWYRNIEQKLGLSHYLSWTFVSCHTGLRKPDPAAYHSACTVLGVPPDRCIFVDDQPVNCEAARAIGMTAIRFTSAHALRSELTALGLQLDG